MTSEEFARFVEQHGGATKTALMLGIAQSQVSQYANGKRQIGNKMLERIRSISSEGELISKSNASLAKSSKFTEVDRVWIDYYVEKVNAGVGVPFSVKSKYKREVDAALVRNPDNSFCMFANGDSMTLAGIIDGSFLVCEHTDKGAKDLIGEVVVANVDGVTVVKRLIQEDQKLILRSESHKNFKDIELSEFTHCIIQGVVLSWHFDSRPYKTNS